MPDNQETALLVEDFKMEIFTDVIGMDALHYGIWDDDLPRNLDGLRAAQKNYAERVRQLIPNGVQTILDVGSGVGDISRHLAQSDYTVTAISPLQSHRRYYPTNDPNLTFHRTRFQEFETDQQFDLILSSESMNYFEFDDAFVRFDQLLHPRGHVLITGSFKTLESGIFECKKAYQDMMAYIVESTPFEVLQDDNVTQEILPTLDLGLEGTRYLTRMISLGEQYREKFTSASLKWRVAFWIIKHWFGEDVNVWLRSVYEYEKMMDRAFFEKHFSYRFILLRKTH
jgi:MPBQ/MSBQ methyltransferase